MASGVPPRFALYYGTGDGSSEKPWNMGLRGTSTTVTGLRPAVSYTFYVAMSQTRGWGPRSAPLVAMTAANCPSPSSEVECMGPVLDAPLVSPLNCMAMVVELPPISTVDGCSMTGREVVVQMRLPGEPWGDVQRDVQSGSVIVGDLDPLQAVEFRIALRRPGQPDWVGQETQRMVAEDGDSMADAAPKCGRFGRAHRVARWRLVEPVARTVPRPVAVRVAGCNGEGLARSKPANVVDRGGQ